jgi:O-antigen/teichoic acid export membrane protein
VIYIREIIFLVSILLGFGFGGKVVQKFAEKDEKEEKI